MTYQEFRKAYPAIRCFQRYDSNARSDRAASHRMRHQQRQAVGEFFYVHSMIPDRAYSTAQQATMAAYDIWLKEHPPAPKAA